jgi:hypothetical protein
MTKSPHRPRDTVIDHEPETPIEVAGCRPFQVRISTERPASSLRAMRSGDVRRRGDRVVIVHERTVVGEIVTRVDEIRSCLEQGVRYEAVLRDLTDELRVEVRPVARH